MSSLPNEIFSDVTNFLPNDDITDLMLMSKTFNALVTPRLKKINQEMSTMDQSIKSFMPSPAPDPTDCKWISQLNLERFKPIGSEAKKRMQKVFENERELPNFLRNATLGNYLFDRLKERMSLERFDDETFLRILGALVSMPKFRKEYNISYKSGKLIINIAIELRMQLSYLINFDFGDAFADIRRIWWFYNPQGMCPHLNCLS
ncbi:hypothetical protein Ddc_15112 [Ditylenchus destructor]|nr:hypothetical protein Ddc_15112 [Ditylenchus destructor]